MKFIVDAMFGRLARWLRMSGYDTIYDKDLKDGRIVMIAKKDGRAVITRDKDVHARALKEGVRTTYISSLNFIKQLEQVKEEYDLTFKDTPEDSRCPKCNAKLITTSKKDIKAKLPEKVGEVYDKFWICQGCGKIYWHGGHWKNIKKTLNELKKRNK